MHKHPILPFAMSVLFVIASSTSARAALVTTWADFQVQVPSNGVLLPNLALGGGSLVDVKVTYSSGRVTVGQAFGTAGAAETGLNYSAFRWLAIGSPGGSGTTPTSLVFSNFRPGPGHIRGFIAVGGVMVGSSPVTVTSSTANTNTWPLTGASFIVAPTNTSAISWNPGLPGTFSTTAPAANHSKTAVVGIGSLATYGAGGTITISLNQDLSDGIGYAIGEESSTGAVPTMTPWGATILSLLLAGAGVALVQRRRALPA